jgi:hypothetical protein
VPRIVLGFATIHDALAAERAAGGLGGIELAELLPLPPSIKSDCGYGLFMDTVLGEHELIAVLNEANILFESAYCVREIDGAAPGKKERSYVRIDQAN